MNLPLTLQERVVWAERGEMQARGGLQALQGVEQRAHEAEQRAHEAEGRLREAEGLHEAALQGERDAHWRVQEALQKRVQEVAQRLAQMEHEATGAREAQEVAEQEARGAKGAQEVAEQAEDRAVGRLERMVEHTGAWMAVAGPGGGVEGLNRAMCRAVGKGGREEVWAGLELDAMLGGALAEGQEEVVGQGIRQCQEEGRGLSLTLATVGGQRWEVQLSPIMRDGAPSGVSLVGLEVTAWHRRVESLRHWGESMKRLVAQAGVPFLELGKAGEVLEWNQALAGH